MPRSCLVLILFAAAFGGACISEAGSDRPAANGATAAPQSTSRAISRFDKPAEYRDGNFTVEHVPVTKPKFLEIDRRIREEKLLEKAADDLNRMLALPYDITLVTKDCDEANALYDADQHTITICYELTDYFIRLFNKRRHGPETPDRKMFDALRFAFLHELGHALIDAYNLPVTGSEEDAADRISVYICLSELGDEGRRAVLAAAEAFSIEAKEGSHSGMDFSDEHLLQGQRFYNTLCMIYGSDPDKYAYLEAPDSLPTARAIRCPAEYTRMIKTWTDLFGPWRKD
jgi:Putative metallopeptidase